MISKASCYNEDWGNDAEKKKSLLTPNILLTLESNTKTIYSSMFPTYVGLFLFFLLIQSITHSFSYICYETVSGW